MNLSAPEDPVLSDMIGKGGHSADIANMILLRKQFAEAFQAAIKSATDLDEMRDHADQTGRMLGYLIQLEGMAR